MVVYTQHFLFFDSLIDRSLQLSIIEILFRENIVDRQIKWNNIDGGEYDKWKIKLK